MENESTRTFHSFPPSLPPPSLPQHKFGACIRALRLHAHPARSGGILRYSPPPPPLPPSFPPSFLSPSSTNLGPAHRSFCLHAHFTGGGDGGGPLLAPVRAAVAAGGDGLVFADDGKQGGEGGREGGRALLASVRAVVAAGGNGVISADDGKEGGREEQEEGSKCYF